MPRKIGIVDDSATVRAAFDLTFAGDDVGLETRAFASAEEALRCPDKLDLLLIDTHIGADDGYVTCGKLRAAPAFASAACVILHGPLEAYDEAKGRAAGAMGGTQKPWESEDLIAKVRAYLSTPAPAVGAAAPAAAPAAPLRPAVPVAPAAPASPPRTAPAPVVIGGARPQSAPAPAAPAMPRMAAPAAPPARPAVPAAPMMRPATPAVPVRPSPAPSAPVAAAVQAFAPKLQTPAPRVDEKQIAQRIEAQVPGLSPEQAQAIAKISREIIEQVAWEVVPDLAEVIIREQLQALLKE